MAGFGDLFGRNGVLEQLVIWNVAGQVISALGTPALTALTQDIQAKHPGTALTPETAAQAVARHILAEATGLEDAAKGGIDAERFHSLVQLARVRLAPDVLAQAAARHMLTVAEAEGQAKPQGIDAAQFAVLHDLAKVRLPPADLAEAELRSYLTGAEADAEAKPQGYSPEQMRVLKDLAGDAPGPDQLMTALLRGIIVQSGRGADSTSYEQGIAETRLHDKWGPVLRQLGEAVLSAPDAATAVVRNFLPDADGIKEAAKSGVNPRLFAIMRDLAGDAPGPQQLAEALRRGAIDEHGRGAESTSFEQGIAEGRLADKWAPVIKALAKLWPTPVDALIATLKGQLTHEEGKRLYKRLGGDDQFYQWLLDSQGEGPTPLEAIDWARRGIIHWEGTGPDATSYAQAFRESRYRDKWQPFYRKAAEYLPPPETVRVMLEQGAIDQAVAIKLWHQNGLDDTTVASYLNTAAFNNTAETRGLAVNGILDMYFGQLIDTDRAHKLLDLFHVPKTNADLMLAYTDMRRSVQAVTTAVRRIQTLLAARKINTEVARQALERLRISPAVIDDVITTTELEASVNVKTLTEAQIVDAFAEGIISQAEAELELQAIGYTPYDAWVLLSVKHKGPLPNKPPRIVAAPLGAVIPGVT